MCGWALALSSAVPERLVDLAGAQQAAQLNRQLVGDGDDRIALGDLVTRSHDLQAMPAQVEILAFGAEDDVRALHQRAPQVLIALLADAASRIALARLPPTRRDPQERTDLPAVREARRILQR